MMKLTCTRTRWAARGPRPGTLLLFFEHALEVSPVARFTELGDVRLEAGPVDPVFAPRNLLEARDLQALAIFDHVHELRCIQQRVVSARIQPSRTAPEQ